MIDKNKQYRTRDGREVRIYAVDGGGERPVHGAINLDGEWECLVWRMDGRLGEYIETDTDLIEVKPRIKREVWVNVYPAWLHSDVVYQSKSAADEGAAGDRIACVKLTIDCEEGEGL